MNTAIITAIKMWASLAISILLMRVAFASKGSKGRELAGMAKGNKGKGCNSTWDSCGGLHYS